MRTRTAGKKRWSLVVPGPVVTTVENGEQRHLRLLDDRACATGKRNKIGHASIAREVQNRIRSVVSRRLYDRARLPSEDGWALVVLSIHVGSAGEGPPMR